MSRIWLQSLSMLLVGTALCLAGCSSSDDVIPPPPPDGSAEAGKSDGSVLSEGGTSEGGRSAEAGASEGGGDASTGGDAEPDAGGRVDSATADATKDAQLDAAVE